MTFYIDPKMAKQNPDKARSILIRQQNKDFETRYRPIEDQLINAVNDNGEAAAQAAGEDVRTQVGITRDSFLRDLARTGTTLTNRQEDTIDRKRGLAMARAIANAENSTRMNIKDQNFQRKADLIGIGKGIVAGADQGLSAAATMQNQRIAAGDAAREATSNQNLNMLATGAGLLAAAFI